MGYSKLDGPAIKGADQIGKALAEFTDKIKVNAIRGGARAGAKAIAAAVKATVPVDSGALKKTVRVSSRARGDMVTGAVKIGNKDAWYAHLIEFATAAHIIKPRRKRALAMRGGGMATTIHHPGTPERPFIRPALVSQAQPALLAMGAYIRARLAKEATKAGIPPPEFTDADESV
jgi:HK97 gp10 family phage protein